jgi:hypothetical protein
MFECSGVTEYGLRDLNQREVKIVKHREGVLSHDDVNLKKHFMQQWMEVLRADLQYYNPRKKCRHKLSGSMLVFEQQFVYYLAMMFIFVPYISTRYIVPMSKLAVATARDSSISILVYLGIAFVSVTE